MKRKFFVLVALMLAVLMLFTACNPEGEREDDGSGRQDDGGDGQVVDKAAEELAAKQAANTMIGTSVEQFNDTIEGVSQSIGQFDPSLPAIEDVENVLSLLNLAVYASFSIEQIEETGTSSVNGGGSLTVADSKAYVDFEVSVNGAEPIGRQVYAWYEDQSVTLGMMEGESFVEKASFGQADLDELLATVNSLPIDQISANALSIFDAVTITPPTVDQLTYIGEGKFGLSFDYVEDSLKAILTKLLSSEIISQAEYDEAVASIDNAADNLNAECIITLDNGVLTQMEINAKGQADSIYANDELSVLLTLEEGNFAASVTSKVDGEIVNHVEVSFVETLVGEDVVQTILLTAKNTISTESAEQMLDYIVDTEGEIVIVNGIPTSIDIEASTNMMNMEIVMFSLTYGVEETEEGIQHNFECLMPTGSVNLVANFDLITSLPTSVIFTLESTDMSIEAGLTFEFGNQTVEIPEVTPDLPQTN